MHWFPMTVPTARGDAAADGLEPPCMVVVGRVVELPVEEGDRLRRGDTIAVLDSTSMVPKIASFCSPTALSIWAMPIPKVCRE